MLTGNDAEAPTAAATTAAASVGEGDGIDNDNSSDVYKANDNDKKNVGNPSLQEVFAQWELESADELMVSTCREVCACMYKCGKCTDVCLSERLMYFMSTSS